MAKKAARTPTINGVTAATHPDLFSHGRDLAEWPRSWMGWEKDLPPGEKLIACFQPFLDHLAASRLSRKTIRKHIDNLWVLGGEIIRDLNEDPSLRKVPVERLLFDLVHDDGGPLIHNCDSEGQQRSLDSTCRKLRRFLTQSPS